MGAGKLANTALFGGVRAIFDLIILTLRFEAAADLTYLYSIYESLHGGYFTVATHYCTQYLGGRRRAV